MNQNCTFMNPEDKEEELGMKIDCLITKIPELETVHTSQLTQLFKRVEELEQFQHDYESWQEQSSRSR